MNILRTFTQRLISLFRKNKLEQELDEEIRSHIEMQAADFERQGLSPAEARYAALRKFGGIDQVKETYRDKRGIPVVENVLRDLTYGLRMLRRSPGTSIVAILSLALGIGVNTALFSAMDAVLLQKLSVVEPDKLIVFEWQAGRPFRMSGMSGTSNVSVTEGGWGLSLFRYDVFAKMHQFQSSQPDNPLTHLIAFGPLRDIAARFGSQAEIIDGQGVTGDYYEALGVQPILGRAIGPQDDLKGAPPVVVLSHKLWRERFNSNTEVIGKELFLNKQAFTIVGVDPSSFTGTLQVDYQPALTIALAHEQLLRGSSSTMGTDTEPPLWWLNVMGRLRDSASADQARESLNSTFQATALEVMPPPRRPNQPAQIDPKDYPRLLTESGSRGMPDTRKEYATTIYGLFIVVAVVLLIACANLANLLLARGVVRMSEMSVRLAVGAGRWRIVRQLLTESLLLSFIGGVVGIVLAFWAKHLIVSLSDKNSGLLPAGVELQLSWRMLLFTLGLSIFTGLLFGIVPALRTTRIDLGTALKQSRRTTRAVSRTSRALLVGQVALSALLLIGAAVFIRSLYNLQKVELGFNDHNLLLFTLQPERAGYKEEALVQLYQQIFERLDRLPGVRSATFGTVPLIANDNWSDSFSLTKDQTDSPVDRVSMRQMMRENYLTTMEIPLLRGRQFGDSDNATAVNVGIVNQAFIRKFFPNEEVLGQRLTFRGGERTMEIVGVVADTKYASQREDSQPILYTPWRQEVDNIGQMHFALRTDVEPATLAQQVREIMRDVDSNLPVTDFTTQTARANETLGEERLHARLLGFFGIVALLLAAIGLFGMLAHSVSQRTKEIGIRMAFGARIGTVLRMVVWEGMKLVLLGIMIGGIAGYVLNRVVERYSYTAKTWQQLKKQLYGVTLSDPFTLVAISGLLLFVALVACWLPARRAAKVDPLVALRYE